MASRFGRFHNALAGFIFSAPPILLCAKSLLSNLLAGALSSLAAELFPGLPCLLGSIWEVLHPCVYQFVFDCVLCVLTAPPMWLHFFNAAL